MTDIDILKKILLPDACAQIEGGTVTLRENHQTEYSVSIRSLPDDCIVIKTDRFREQDTFLTDENGIQKRCDYVLISESNKKIIFIELKKGSPNSKDIISQLKGGTCVIEYLRNISVQFWESNILSEYKKIYIAWTDAGTSKKRGTRKVMRGDFSKPDSYMKLSGKAPLHFMYIISSGS